MKTLLACFVCLAFAPGAPAQDNNGSAGKKTDTPQLTLELIDGSRIVGTPGIDRFEFDTQYAHFEIQLSLLRTIEFAGAKRVAQVDLKNGDHFSGGVAATKIAMKTVFGPVVIPLGKVLKIRTGAAGMFVNSLGMRFVPVPGTDALFSVWDTRVRDYRVYADANPSADASWKTPGFKQDDDHPVVKVSWDDAQAFCAWLTQKERKEGTIAQDQEYRLPTDKEWTAAVGSAKYAWGGNDWPPPKGAGNYGPGLKVDDFDNTSPVGAFDPNEYGLYDMGGNVWQWCEDWFRGDMNEAEAADRFPGLRSDGGGMAYRVVRGASCYMEPREFLLSTLRNNVEQSHRAGDYGFRCVLAPVVPSR